MVHFKKSKRSRTFLNQVVLLERRFAASDLLLFIDKKTKLFVFFLRKLDFLS